MKRLFLLMLPLTLFTGCFHWVDLFNIPNNDDRPVYMFVPRFFSVPKHATYDSTIYFSALELRLVPPNETYKISVFGKLDEEFAFYMEQFPSDTVHVFFFDPEVVDNNGWNQIRENYMVLKRYDLSHKELSSTKILNALWPPKAEAACVRQYPEQ